MLTRSVMADETMHPNAAIIPKMSTIPRQRCNLARCDEDLPVRNMLSLMG